MSGKARESTSPVRVSRLKKRRRQKESNDGTGITCALQNLPAPSEQSRRPSRSRSDDDIATKSSSGLCKGNLLNGLTSLSGRASVGGKGSECVIDGNGSGGLDTNDLHPAGASIQSSSAEGAIERQLFSPNTNKSTLEFMDSMEPSVLLSAIPSMLGLDMTRYKSSSGFKQDLELAFEYKVNHTDEPPAKKLKYSSTRDKGIYHSLVGRIDPHSSVFASGAVDDGGNSIAFPQCRDSFREEEQQDDYKHLYLQHLNLNRKSGHGMCIPSSWYQFPSPKTRKSLSPEMTLVNVDDDRLSAKLNKKERSERKPPSLEKVSEDRPSKKNVSEQSATKPPFPKMSPVNRVDNRGGAKGSRKSNSSLAIKSPPPPLKYKGEIRILSRRGATIREVFDIDKSNRVVGKLNNGDKRYFLEKKTLPPPPISLLDESDEESDEECVAVVRYKIVLKPADCALQGGCNEMVGWISDRGRFADESYLILREV